MIYSKRDRRSWIMFGEGGVPPEPPVPSDLSDISVLSAIREADPTDSVVYTISFNFLNFVDGATHVVVICSDNVEPTDPPTNILDIQTISVGGTQSKEFLAIPVIDIVNPLYIRAGRVVDGVILWGPAHSFDSTYPPLDDPLSLTSEANGFIAGVDFLDPAILTGTDIKNAIDAFGGDPSYTPAAGRFSIVDDEVIGKCASLTFTGGTNDFWMYILGAVANYKSSVRVRIIFKALNVLSSDITAKPLFLIHQEGSSPYQRLIAELNGSTTLLICENLAGATTVSDGGTPNEMAKVTGETWREWILESYNNGIDTVRFRFYYNDIGFDRPTFLSSSGTYVNPTTPQFDGTAFMSDIIPNTVTERIRIIEICDVFDTEGNYIPITNMGK